MPILEIMQRVFTKRPSRARGAWRRPRWPTRLNANTLCTAILCLSHGVRARLLLASCAEQATFLDECHNASFLSRTSI
ncbi:hypothetical protein LY78DRAFT_211115 [Colletotrichum sublineola]|nr:hypothetical protein LY78DRAFT_211115 [Colletotrichum sublineola]